MAVETSRGAASAALRSTHAVVRSFVDAVPAEWVDRIDLAWLRGLPDETRSVRVLVAHMAVYEERLAVAAQRHLAGATPVPDSFSTRMTPLRPDVDALADQPLDIGLARLRTAVADHADLVESMDEERFTATGSDFWNVDRWGVRESAAWVCGKSIEHLMEHGHVIARVALFHDVAN